jgi:hypothetical protein
LSQGGYALLDKNTEKLKEIQEVARGEEVPPPSPPQRHERWKRARLKPSGEYTSEETCVIAEKIESKYVIIQLRVQIYVCCAPSMWLFVCCDALV